MAAVRHGLIFSLAFVILQVVWIWPMIRVRRIEQAAAEIRNGDEQKRVVELAGRPWKYEVCGTLVPAEPTGCAIELVYAHPYAPLVPEYWVFYIDSRQHVLSHYHSISP